MVKRTTWQRFMQALADWRKTDYPGCCRGVMNCRSTVCGCINESSPNPAFIPARMIVLKEEEGGG